MTKRRVIPQVGHMAGAVRAKLENDASGRRDTGLLTTLAVSPQASCDARACRHEDFAMEWHLEDGSREATR